MAWRSGRHMEIDWCLHPSVTIGRLVTFVIFVAKYRLPATNTLELTGYMTTPPPTSSVCPVMNAAAGEARNTAAPATSSGVPQRPSGVASDTSALRDELRSAANDVSIHPGASTLTRTRGPSDRASDLLNASTPPFTAANSCGLVPGMPVST